jgi:glycosyltransferase involved in cell wall biosynthesis
MTAGRKAVRILFVDQAVGFGGSIIVISHLLACLKRNHFSAVVVGEMDESVLAHHVRGRAKLEILRRPLNYVHMENFSNFLRRCGSPLLHRAGMYAFTIAAVIANITYMVRLGAIIVRQKIDVMHVNQSDNTEAIIVGLLLGRKIVIHVHGTGHVGFSYRWIMRTIRHVVAISEYIKRDLVENRVPASRISVVPNPTIIRPPSKQALERVKAAYEILPGQKIFGIFGRLVRWKGHKEFIDAAQIVLEKEPTARAFIVGDVSDGDKDFLAELQDMVRRAGLQDRVTFTGYIQEVDNLYSIMDVVVHASIEPEPFGLVITEAMAHGVPVVASNLGATREIITHGVDGFLMDPKKPTEMATAILGLLRDEPLRRAMGARAAETVRRKYNGNAYARRMGEVYRNVIGLA